MNAEAHPFPWVIDGAECAARAARGHQVVDVRNRVRFAISHAPCAVRLSWLDFRDGRGRTGKLPDDLLALRQRLARRGIDVARPVTVCGDARAGWGEDGRVVWMLRYLGFSDVALVDGGFEQMRADTAASDSSQSTRHKSTPLPDLGVQHALRASIDDVQRVVGEGAGASTLLIDTRSMAEWNGSRRYLPARGGRIPGAVHLEWRSLLDAEGRLDRSQAMRERLAQLGILPSRPIITYCVGGVRSAHLLVMLRALGFADVRNYEGSWYEWAADGSRLIVP